MSRSLKPTPRQLARFSRFEMIAHEVVEGYMTGMHRSPYKGFAVEFAEHRQYVPGDDLKHLDWKLLGRLNRYYIKQYEEDTSLRAHLLLDASGSMDYCSGGQSKFEYGCLICAILSYVLLQQQDAVGLLTFDSQIRDRLPPRSAQRQYRAIVDRLQRATPGQETNLGTVLHRLASMITRRTLIVIVSDFFDDVARISRALTHFAHKKHEVIVFQVLDRREATFSFTDLARFDSLEDESAIIADPVRYRREYRRQFEAHQRELRRNCHQLRIDYNEMFTDEPVERAMARCLAERLKQ